MTLITWVWLVVVLLAAVVCGLALVSSLKTPSLHVRFAILFIKYEGPLVGLWPILFLGAFALLLAASVPSLAIAAIPS